MRVVIERYLVRPFESAVGLFVIMNGILTFTPESVVRQNLENIIGYGSIAVPMVQILAGLLKIFGIGANMGNLEAAGLLTVASMFSIRIFMLVADGDITVQDINSITIALLIILCNTVRVGQILRNVKTLSYREGP